MKIKRYSDAEIYDAPGHFGMTARRLQDPDDSAAGKVSVGFSIFEPNGGAERGSSPIEKIYVVLEGEIQVSIEAGDFTLKTYDSCRIEPNEERAIINATNRQTKMLVITPTG